jgi:hypothetical protein
MTDSTKKYVLPNVEANSGVDLATVDDITLHKGNPEGTELTSEQAERLKATVELSELEGDTVDPASLRTHAELDAALTAKGVVAPERSTVEDKQNLLSDALDEDDDEEEDD